MSCFNLGRYAFIDIVEKFEDPCSFFRGNSKYFIESQFRALINDISLIEKVVAFVAYQSYLRMTAEGL
jgi:hypothetical protein